MAEVTRILSQIESGDPAAAEQLLPLVYDELRKLAAVKLAHEKPGQTLQATALVHEAYLRLVGTGDGEGTSSEENLSPVFFNSRGHFFGAAAEAMRRILVESARRKGSLKQGGGLKRVDMEGVDLAVELPGTDLVALDEALVRLAERDSQSAKLVQLHCFAGLTIEQAAGILGIPERTAYRDWSFARAWLHRELRDGQSPPGA